MMGYSLDELIGMDGLLLVVPDHRDMVKHKIVSGYGKSYEANGLRKNGEQFPIRIEARTVPYKGESVRSVEFRDITEAKQAEDALRKSEKHTRLLNTFPLRNVRIA
jgi:PAS domain S-box-containing protein